MEGTHQSAIAAISQRSDHQSGGRGGEGRRGEGRGGEGRGGEGRR